jgi:tRNA(Ser,Leu) C12 N-acetylase TAN1
LSDIKPCARWRRNLSVIMDLLVSHPRGYYGPAKQEIARILGQFGDPQPRVEKSGVPGVCVVHTALDNRQVIARCAELYHSDPGAFRFAIKWVPVDYWCAKDLDAIRRLIEEHVAPCIGAEETWGMQVEKRGWAQYHTAEIIERLAGAIDRKVRLKAPDRLVRIDLLGNAAATSVLRPGEIFSIYALAP